MEKLILGTHHISLNPNGRDAFFKTVSFYRDVLGMDVVRSWDTGNMLGAMLWTGNSVMEIGCGNDDPGAGCIRHFALATNDVDAVAERVRNAGYNITMEPRDLTLPSEPPFPIRIAFCSGPCGESIELFCEK